jgi:methylated-DNA-[protein]-cysteine S-methyltransferase
MTTTAQSPTTAPLATVTTESPVGILTLTASAAGIRSILWPLDGRRSLPVPTATAPGDNPTAQAHLAAAVRQLGEYFAGVRQSFDVALDPQGTPFQLAAWMVLREIPYGSTMSYADQARRLGDVKRARAVGAANGRNPLSIIVPCHRVVGANGSLTGFAGGIESKAFLLDLEHRIARLF